MRKYVYFHVEDLPHWIPVTERLPDRYWDGFSKIVVVTAGNAFSVGRYYKCPLDDEGQEGGRWYTEATMPVTYWMPLPEPPRCEAC